MAFPGLTDDVCKRSDIDNKREGADYCHSCRIGRAISVEFSCSVRNDYRYDLRLVTILGGKFLLGS